MSGCEGQRTTISLVLAVLLLPIVVLGLATQAPAEEAADPCAVAFDQGRSISLEMAATRDGSALPSGAAIKAGDSVNLNLTWNTDDWGADEIRILDLCFRIAGAAAPALYASETPAANDGSFQHSFRVPAVNAGDELCVRARLMGKESADGKSLQRSNILRFTAAAPEVAPTQGPAPAPTPTTEVLGQQVSQPAVVAPQETAPSPTATQSPTQVLGVQTVRLPVTGPERTWTMAIVALAFIATGIALVRRPGPGAAPSEPTLERIADHPGRSNFCPGAHGTSE